MLELTFRHDGHVTKNFLHFVEVDAITGNLLEKKDAGVLPIYVAKSVFTGMNYPDEITVKVEW